MLDSESCWQSMAVRLRAPGRSCEPGRTRAYSEDVHWRKVWQREIQELPLAKVAENLSVDVSTVHRVVKKFRTTGTVMKKRYATGNLPVKMTKPVQLTVLRLDLDKPGIYLREIQQELVWMFGLSISLSSLCNFPKKNNFTRKKMQLVASQRSEELRAKFVSDVSTYKDHFPIFIDDTGSDRRNALKCQKLLVRGERISVIAAMTINSVIDLKVIQKQLLPHLMNFDGFNSNSVVIMDNCSVHHVTGVSCVIRGMGSIVQYLPPYSPDFNPIELLFSKVKSSVKEMELELSATMDIESIVLSAFATVTAEDCKAWIRACRIYSNEH